MAIKSTTYTNKGDSMALVIDLSRDVGYRDIWAISTGRAKAYVDPKALDAVLERRRDFLASIEKGGKCYGVTTGVGGLRDFEVDPTEVARRSAIFLREHAAGSGPPLSRSIVRGAMAILARQLTMGYSAASPDVISLLVDMLNRDIAPLVPSYGSLGASGGLAL